MKKLSYACLSIFLLLVLAGSMQAQVTCDDLVKSTQDTVRVMAFKGRPGTIVEMPFYLSNDSIVTSFQFLVKYDTAWLKPVFIRDSTCTEFVDGSCISWAIDSGFVDYKIASSRFLKTKPDPDDPFGEAVDTVTKFQAYQWTDSELKLRQDILACSFLPQGDQFDSLPGGNDVIFTLYFEVDPNMPQDQKAYFQFFESDIFRVDTVQGIPDTTFYPGCNTSQMTTTGIGTDGETATFQIYPRLYPSNLMFFQADTAWVPPAPPEISSFVANPASISEGGSSSLQWTVTNTDSIVIRNATTNARLFKSVNVSSSYSVSPTVTTQYSLTAYGGTNQVSAFATVTVGGGGGTTGNPPTISFTPSQTSYDVNQGETVSFTVTATDPENKNVTLTVLSPPNNSTFPGPVIGPSPVSGAFSFTPDFNQQGQFAVVFRATDADNDSRDATVLINVNELQFDRLFSTSAPGQKPVGGLRGTGEILFPINLITSQTVYGVQYDMRFNYQMITVDSFIQTGRIPEWFVSTHTLPTPGEIRVVTFGLANEPVENDTTSAILHVALTLDSAAVPWSSEVIHIENGWESIDPNPDIPSLPLVTDSGVVEVDRYGDVNLDKMINVADAVNIVAKIIGTYGLNSRQFATADLDLNDTVNVYDLISDVNLIHDIPVNPAAGQPATSQFASVSLSYDDIVSGSNEVLKVTSELPEKVAGVQLEIDYDPNTVSLGKPVLTKYNEKFALGYNDNRQGRLNVVLYHLSPENSSELLQIGVADLIEIPMTAHSDITADDKSKLRLSTARLATATAQSVPVKGMDGPMLPGSFTLSQNYPNPFNPTTTIEFSIDAFDGTLGNKRVTLDVFNILGQRVATLLDDVLPPGEHTIEWNATNDNGQRVATGIYLYRLKVGDQSKTRKMLFLK
jgi:hypothetical protein